MKNRIKKILSDLLILAFIYFWALILMIDF